MNVPSGQITSITERQSATGLLQDISALQLLNNIGAYNSLLKELCLKEYLELVYYEYKGARLLACLCRLGFLSRLGYWYNMQGERAERDGLCVTAPGRSLWRQWSAKMKPKGDPRRDVPLQG